MVNVYFSKSVDRQQYEHLAERLAHLQEYFVKFCGEQYRDKIEHFFDDCKFCIIDKTMPLTHEYFYFTRPSKDDSSSFFNMQILYDAFTLSKFYWPSEKKELDALSLPEPIVNAVKEHRDLIKEAVDTYYTSLFSIIENNTKRDSPHYVYRTAFGNAIRPLFEIIADEILKKHDISISPRCQDLFKDFTIRAIMQCCASFGDYSKNPKMINTVAEDIYKYSTGIYYDPEEIPEEYMEIAKEIQTLGDFFVGRVVKIIANTFHDSTFLAYYDELEEIFDNVDNDNSKIEFFYNEMKVDGLTVCFKNSQKNPYCLIANNSREKTIVHEATHGISFYGLEDETGNLRSLNEVVTEFIARGVCRLMRQDRFKLFNNNDKTYSCGYSLALQYIKELTDKYQNLFLEAYFKNRNVLFDEFGPNNIGRLDYLLESVINGEAYYDENIQTDFEDLFDDIEKYRQSKSENENGV